MLAWSAGNYQQWHPLLRLKIWAIARPLSLSRADAQRFATRTKDLVMILTKVMQSGSQRARCTLNLAAIHLAFYYSPPHPGVLAVTAFSTQQRRKGRIYSHPKCNLCLSTVFHKVSLYLGQRNTLPLSTATTTPFTWNCRAFVCARSLNCLHRQRKWSEPSPCFSKKGVGEKCRFALYCSTETQPQFSLLNGLF